MKSCFNRVKVGWGAVIAAICAAMLFPLSADAEQIDASQFKRSFNITFPGYAGSSTLMDFPVLIRLSRAMNDFRYDNCAPNGGDLRFTDADGNLLMSEVDTWVENGTSLVWVKVPSLNSSTVIKAYYGYKGAGDPPEVNPKSVWSNGYLGVWHLGESARPLRDSTTSGLDFTAATGWSNRTKSAKLGEYDDCNTYGAAEGAVGRAVTISRATSGHENKGGILAPDETGIIGGLDAMTVEIWAKCTGDSFPSSAQYLVSKRRASGAEPKFRPFQVYYNNSSKLVCDIYLDDSAANDGVYTAGTKVSPNSATIDTSLAGKWNYHVFQYDKAMSSHTNYLNGAYSASTSSSTGYPQIPGFIGDEYYALCLGNDAQPSSQSAFNGSLDELRISNVARSKDWVKASYDTVHSDEFAAFSVADVLASYAKRFTVSFPRYEGATLVDFPVLVKLSEDSPVGFSYDDCVKENGDDLRFLDENGNILASEVDTWDCDGVSTIWVKVPSFSATTKLTAYYGSAFAPPVTASDVWANGYVGVWHLGESGMTMDNSTPGGIDFTCDSTYTDLVGRGVGGLVGNAVEFDIVTEGSNAHKGHLYLSDPKHMYCGRSTMTVEYWLCQRQAAHNRRLMYCKTGNARAYDIYSQTSSAGYDKYSFVFGTTNTLTSVTNNPVVTINGNNAYFQTWKHHAAVFDSEVAGALTVYGDGTSKGSKSLAAGDVVIPLSRDLRLGNLSSTQAFPGKFDEVRISGVARSAAWLKATYDTINNNADFTTYGRVEDNFPGLFIMVR